MAHHEIPVFLDDEDGPVPQIPPAGTIRVGDTVSYTSNDGVLTIEFELPFSEFKDTVRQGEIRLMTRAGNFVCKCYLHSPDGTFIDGWSPQKPKAGGEHDVRPAVPAPPSS